MFAQAFATFFKWLMGEAPEGQRKLVFGARVEIMLFAALLVALFRTPVSGEIVDTLVGAMVAIGITTVGGNSIEWASKSFSGKPGKP